MRIVRRAEERFHTKISWLDSKHSFSFAEHYDPEHMGFRALRVINEDRITAGAGFPTHPHRDMEILSYVLDGALEHRDSMGNGSVIRPGDVQRMSAGTGVRHSEGNPQRDAGTHFMQIWLVPERRGIDPSYEQKSFTVDERSKGFRLIAARDGRDGAITVHADADLYSAVLGEGATAKHALREGRHAWVQVLRGTVRLGETELRAGDGVALSEVSSVELEGVEPGEVLLFDLA